MNTIATNKFVLVLLSIFSILFFSSISIAQGEDKTEMAKVVYHADYSDPQRMSSMLTSIFNMVTTYENQFIEYDIRIVFYPTVYNF